MPPATRLDARLPGSMFMCLAVHYAQPRAQQGICKITKLAESHQVREYTELFPPGASIMQQAQDRNSRLPAAQRRPKDDWEVCQDN